LRGFLKDELGRLLPQPTDATTNKKPRLVVLIDDLDRCEPQAAYRLLEGIKIYLNLPNCVFVLGVNQGAIEASLAEQLVKEKAENVPAEARLRARDYLEKICKNFWHIPPYGNLESLVNRWLIQAKLGDEIDQVRAATIKELGDTIAKLAAEYWCLPANPRRIKAFVNTLARFLEKTTWTPPVDQLEDKLKALKSRAGLILALACLYQFHPDIYRIVNWHAGFFLKICEWCKRSPTEMSDKENRDHEVLRHLRQTGEFRTIAEAATPEPANEFQTSYPDPERGNLLRIQELLVQDWFEVENEEVIECLL
jgi:hypothetical protein